MAFEDDMIEAGYSNEQDYLDSLFDDFDRIVENQHESNNYDDYDYYEERELERAEMYAKRDRQRQFIENWEAENPDLAIIWRQHFRASSHYADIAYLDNRRFVGLDKYNELRIWIKKRCSFETDGQRKKWADYKRKLNDEYKKELLNFYFPEDDRHVSMSVIPQQAQELREIIKKEPELWKLIDSQDTKEQHFFEDIEEQVFGIYAYERKQDYDYWKDKHMEEFLCISKEWAAASYSYHYSDWQRKHTQEEAEWKAEHTELFDFVRRNFETREMNSFIEERLKEYEEKLY